MNNLHYHNFLNKIKNKYLLMQLLENISERRLLNIIKYNKSLQLRLEISIDTYEEFSNIELDIIPSEYNAMTRFHKQTLYTRFSYLF